MTFAPPNCIAPTISSPVQLLCIGHQDTRRTIGHEQNTSRMPRLRPFGSVSVAADVLLRQEPDEEEDEEEDEGDGKEDDDGDDKDDDGYSE
jgi:hypothetical protein